MPELLTAIGDGPRWWFVPYQDPHGQHLRVRLLLPDPDAAAAAVRPVGRWAARLRAEGLLDRIQLDTYQPETGRYGAGAAMAAAEQVFAADSHVAVVQRQAAIQTTVPADALAAAGLVDLAASFLDDQATAMRWLITHLPHEPIPGGRGMRTAALRLADPTSAEAAVQTAWEQRREALASYRAEVAAQQDPTLVLPSLLHLHHVRMFGVDPDRERLGRHLTRAVAMHWSATAGRS
jgi:thiopeptide-type bacteriocin biosynthesis protein